jgi:hypothetical protein
MYKKTGYKLVHSKIFRLKDLACKKDWLEKREKLTGKLEHLARELDLITGMLENLSLKGLSHLFESG